MSLANDLLKRHNKLEEAKSIPIPDRLFELVGFGRDSNGNAVVKLKNGQGKGFSIQTNGNLPSTHRMYGLAYKAKDLSDAQLQELGAEVYSYITAHGTKKMKEHLEEAKHYNTKVRSVDEKMGSRKIRLGVQETKRMVENMLKSGNNFPNPANKESKKNLEECGVLMHQTVERLRAVKDSKRPLKEDNTNEAITPDLVIPSMMDAKDSIDWIIKEAKKKDAQESELVEELDRVIVSISLALQGLGQAKNTKKEISALRNALKF